MCSTAAFYKINVSAM
uniref:Uncharacterized protein n=1 Tax=Anguilla anguilla TaxID=7936 RepID=A0A0E9PAT8_ANGAN